MWPSVHAALRSLRSVPQVARLLMSCATVQQLFTASVPRACMHAKWLQSCPTLCNPMNYIPPGSSVHGTLQARILEWVAMPSSRGSPGPMDRTHVSFVFCIGRQVLYHWSLLGGPSVPQFPHLITIVKFDSQPIGLLCYAVYYSAENST